MNWTTKALTVLVVGLLRKYMPFAVVSIDGLGWYSSIKDAVDAGEKLIFVRNGTYGPQGTITMDKATLIGQSWDVVIDGDDTTAVEFRGDNNFIANMSFQTTAGGGNAAYAMLWGGSGHDKNVVFRCRFVASDDVCYFVNGGKDHTIAFCQFEDNMDDSAIYLGGIRNMCIGNRIQDTGASSMRATSSGDTSLWLGNFTLGGLDLDAGADSSLVVGNAHDGTLTDDSTGSTVASNENF